MTLGGPAPAVLSRPRLATDEYVGDTADRTGFGGLEAIEDVTMLAVPDLMSAYQRCDRPERVQAVQLAMIAHCELMGDRVAILDPPPGLGAQQIKDWRIDDAGYDSKYAALYWPWVKVIDPARGTQRVRPAERPHGRASGARNDDTRGVHKAPANEVMRGVIDLETNDHPRRARPAQPRRDQLHPRRSPAGASGSGAPARCPAIRRGGT